MNHQATVPEHGSIIPGGGEQSPGAHKMTALDQALAIFQAARELYLDRQFQQARERIQQYHERIDYDRFTRRDRRPAEPIRSSVVIVSHNSGSMLLKCLDSVFTQTDPAHEVILVDNGSNETVHSQLADLPILWIIPPINLFPSEGRNLGTHFARGEYLIFLDDDALMAPDYIAQARQAMEEHGFLALRGRIAPKTATMQTPPAHYDLGGQPIPTLLTTEGNMVIQRQALTAVGGFDPLLFGHEGLELTQRCLERFPGRDIYYWPSLVIQHDFASDQSRQEAKRARKILAMEYLEVFSPGAVTLLRSLSQGDQAGLKNTPYKTVNPKQEKAVTNSGISIIIRTDQDPQLLATLLDSFVQHNTHKPVEMLIAAQRPSEALAVIKPFVARLFIRLLPPDAISSAVPIGTIASMVRYDYALFLNDRAVFQGDSLPVMLKSLQADRADALLNKNTSLSSILFCRTVALSELDRVSADTPIPRLIKILSGKTKIKTINHYDSDGGQETEKQGKPHVKSITSKQKTPLVWEEPLTANPNWPSSPQQTQLTTHHPREHREPTLAARLLEAENNLFLLEEQLTAMDSSIEAIEKDYLLLEEGSKKHQLKQQLEEMVLASSQLLIELKNTADDLHELRILNLNHGA